MITIGRRVSHFRVLEKLAEGGMGEVYKAEDTHLHRTVALKFLPEELSSDEQARARFVDEAQAASALDHPNICVVHEIDRSEEGRFFIAMAFYEGRTLGEREQRAVPVAEPLRIVCQIARGLGAAHSAGIVHRDVKPSNVMLTRSGVVKILDFGVAKLKGRGDRTDTGRVVGTVAYMAPEQIRGEEVDARSDIFSLGVLFCELLSGRRPFAGENPAALMHAVLNDAPELPGLSREIDRSIARMLARKKDDRYRSVEELLEDLEALGACSSVDTRERTAPLPSWLRTSPPSGAQKRNLARWAWVAGLVVAGLLGWYWQRPPPAAVEREWLLISDFENSTGLPVFDKTLAEALALAIEQSRFVNVVSRERVYDALRRMKRDPAVTVDEELGLEICRREGVSVLLAGSVRRVGETFQITVRARDVPTGDLVVSDSEVFRQVDELFARADALAERVRRALGERALPIARHSLPLEKATTTSLEALRLSTQARDLMLAGEFEDAVQLLDGALEIDPEFATAHLRLASAHDILGRAELGSAHLERAHALRGGVSERERYLIEGRYLSHLERYEESVESYRILVGLYPDDIDAHHGLALAWAAMGRQTDAIAELREVLRLNPFDRNAWGNLILFLAQTNESSEAIAVYREAVERELESPYLRWGLGLAFLGEGRISEARREFDHLVSQGGVYEPLGSLYLARTEVFQGQLDRAETRLQRDIRTDLLSGNRQYEALRRLLLAEVYLLLDRRAEVRRQLERVLEQGPELQVDQLRAVGSLFARLGDVSEAQSTLGRVEARSDSSAAYATHCLHYLRGEIALAQGLPALALEKFDAAQRAYPMFRSHEGRARAHGAAGDWPAAAVSWRRVLDSKGDILRHGFPALYPTAHVELIQAHRALGQTTDAEALCDVVDRLWARAQWLPLYPEACRATVVGSKPLE